jgi:hypothetical protein
MALTYIIFSKATPLSGERLFLTTKNKPVPPDWVAPGAFNQQRLQPSGDPMKPKRRINQTIGKKMAVATIALAFLAVGNVRAEMGDNVDQSNVKHNAVAVRIQGMNAYFEHALIIGELPGASGQIVCVLYLRVGQELTESELRAFDQSNLPSGTHDFQVPPASTVLPVGMHGWHSEATGLFVLQLLNYPLTLEDGSQIVVNGRVYATTEGLELMGKLNKGGNGLMPKVNP